MQLRIRRNKSTFVFSLSRECTNICPPVGVLSPMVVPGCVFRGNKFAMAFTTYSLGFNPEHDPNQHAEHLLRMYHILYYGDEQIPNICNCTSYVFSTLRLEREVGQAVRTYASGRPNDGLAHMAQLASFPKRSLVLRI